MSISWPTKTLSDICVKPQYGFTASASLSPIGPRFLRITDLQNGTLNWSSVPFCECPDKESAKYRLDHGDIVVARIGATTGRTSLILDPPESVFGSYLIRLRPGKELNPFFFYFFTLSQSYKSWIDGNKENNLKGGVNTSILAQIEIPLPPMAEQQKIAALLWKIQRAIEVEEKLNAAARELKQGAMRLLFTCGLRGEAQHDTDAGLVPESWKVSSIRANYRLVAGGTPERGNATYWDGGAIPWVKTGEVNYCVINDTEEKITQIGLENSAAKILPKGAVLVAMYGQGITRGKVAMLDIEASTNQACVGLIPLNDRVLPTYLYHYLTFSYERLRSLSHGAQQQNLNAELVGGFPIAYPDPEKDAKEQKEIVQVLSAIDSKINLHERKRRAFCELFQTLLHKLMTGEIRVADLDIDVSEVTQ